MSEQEILGPAMVGDLAGLLLAQLKAPARLVSDPGDVARTDAERREREERALRDDLERRRREVVQRALEVVPPKIRETVAGVGILEDTHAAQVALAWAGDVDAPRLLLLRGPVGVGKSVAMALAIRKSALRGRGSSSWHRPNDFVSGMLHTYDANAPKVGRDIVAVDDVGRETKAEFSEALCTFIDDCSARIILTTNLTKAQFRERYNDPRLLDRMREVGQAVDLKGVSRRRQSEDF